MNFKSLSFVLAVVLPSLVSSAAILPLQKRDCNPTSSSGYTSHSYWLTLTVQNSADASQQWTAQDVKNGSFGAVSASSTGGRWNLYPSGDNWALVNSDENDQPNGCVSTTDSNVTGVACPDVATGTVPDSSTLAISCKTCGNPQTSASAQGCTIKLVSDNTKCLGFSESSLAVQDCGNAQTFDLVN